MVYGLWIMVYGLWSIALYGGGDMYGAAAAANGNVHEDMYGAMILGNSRSESQATPSKNQLQHSTDCEGYLSSFLASHSRLGLFVGSLPRHTILHSVSLFIDHVAIHQKKNFQREMPPKKHEGRRPQPNPSFNAEVTRNGLHARTFHVDLVPGSLKQVRKSA